jgi:ubiquinone/menaquinone biosynthesis C-methylase UbiE
MASSKEYFAEVAERWDELREGFFTDSLRDKAIALSEIKAGSLAVDVGAGTGFMSEGLLAAGARVVAVDDSEEMLSQARAKLGVNKGIEFRLGSAEKIPVPDGTADFVFANMVLHHVEHPGVAVKEMARILKPGGRVVVTDLDRHDAVFLKTEHHDRWMGFDRAAVREFISAAGLEEATVVGVGELCCATSSCGEKAEISIFAAVGRKPTHKTIK